MRFHLRSITTLAALAAAACGGSTEPRSTDERPSGDLTVVTRVNAPALVSSSVSFWAKKGENREAVLVYANSASGGGGAEFMRLRIDAKSLDRRPDGSAIAVGDSVLITATAVPGRVQVELQPSGLRFSAADPAEIKLRFAESNDDINGDGRHDATDDALKLTLAVWAQESAGLPWTKLVTDLRLDVDEAHAKLLGFTSYAVAY